ncbi:helix-turn-helix domain-containing protein [Sporolactobacillus kofuensis]|uniref:Helix-turn-helix domain-containing protein n=1 Tax=Sporolactobacillus kofuensis TaxID=269672 RepID=A0ABW1WEI3_9BACL|nr:helix-turn-helix domain-containing protein [Sporolactobacillus kofuensis]MCO7174496.1 helix-turn-helix domain-containing protein [Sporolactobacillus kofuensis]
MSIEQLMVNYPGTICKKIPFQPDKGTIYFFHNPYYTSIPLERLTDRERMLIESLFHQEIPPYYSPSSQYWYDLLINGTPLTSKDQDKKIRVIYYYLNTPLAYTDRLEWDDALKAFFDIKTSFVSLSSQRGFIIEETGLLSEQELDAIANTLANDFSIQCSFQIGLKHAVSPRLKQIFSEELRLFEKTITETHVSNVTSVESKLFSQLRPQLNKWSALEDVRMLIAEDDTWVAILHAIWAYQGNISLAAKHLYMHRNTLQYRMDKFYEATGISLRKMNGLTIAYMSTL